MLLKADQPAANYWISVVPQYRTGAPAGYAVLHYAAAGVNASTFPATTAPQPVSITPWSDSMNAKVGDGGGRGPWWGGEGMGRREGREGAWLLHNRVDILHVRRLVLHSSTVPLQPPPHPTPPHCRWCWLLSCWCPALTPRWRATAAPARCVGTSGPRALSGLHPSLGVLVCPPNTHALLKPSPCNPSQPMPL